MRHTDRRSLVVVSGEGFHSDGTRLGGSHAIPQHIGRIKGLEAAERRAAKSALMGKGGRLGGASPITSGGVVKSPREMAVEVSIRIRGQWSNNSQLIIHSLMCSSGCGEAPPRRQIVQPRFPLSTTRSGKGSAAKYGT